MGKTIYKAGANEKVDMAIKANRDGEKTAREELVRAAKALMDARDNSQKNSQASWQALESALIEEGFTTKEEMGESFSCHIGEEGDILLLDEDETYDAREATKQKIETEVRSEFEQTHQGGH